MLIIIYNFLYTRLFYSLNSPLTKYFIFLFWEFSALNLYHTLYIIILFITQLLLTKYITGLIRAIVLFKKNLWLLEVEKAMWTYAILLIVQKFGEKP